MPSRDEQIARMASQKVAVEMLKGREEVLFEDLKTWIDFFYDDIMAMPGPEAITPKTAKPGDRPLTDDEEAKVLAAIKDSGKRIDLILRSIGRDKAESLTVNDSKQIKALLGS